MEINCPNFIEALALETHPVRKEDAKSEQINIPANPYHYWNYRLHCQLETLIDNQDWTEFLKKFIKESKRAY